jgi:O-antigen ligase
MRTTHLPRVTGLHAATSNAFLLPAGAAATCALVYLLSEGATLEISAVFGLVAFLAVVAGFVYVPWITVAAAMPLYVALPTLRIFVNPLVGGMKDLVSLAAVAAAAVVLVQSRVARKNVRLDSPAVVLIGLIVILYITNLGGNFSGETGYGEPWFQGVRLFCQPLLLLFVGMVLPNASRTFRAAAISLIVTSVVVALVGLAQQALGVGGLLELGYVYGEQVREVGSRLRSFGTLAEPFAYAGFLLIGLAILLTWSRGGLVTYVALAIVTAGLAVSYVRTAAVIGVALLGLTLAKLGYRAVAAALIAASAIAATTVLFIASQEKATRSVQVSSTTFLTLNGRTDLWQAQLGNSPADLLLGRGVGATGTAAERAQRSLSGKTKLNATDESTVVDSGYLAVVADVGVVGLLLLLALFTRLLMLGRALARTGDRRGWGAVGVLVVILLDALSRESLTGFPTAYVGMLLIGLGVAVSTQDRPTHAVGRAPA